METSAKYSDSDYLDFDPFQGDESQLTCRKVTLPTARKPHPCFFGLGDYGDKHVINSGERYRLETARVDGDFWGKWRCCLPCMTRQLDELLGDDDEAAAALAHKGNEND